MSEDAPLNKLRYETSPYLLQHANNPVHWHPWGEEALNRAIVEDKPILVSIGYAACHWCHVMEKQSFEDVRVANAMNDNFVCIKVDREERPDIDQVYMNAVQLITGGGGWPLNCFALPDGSPFYGGTYFPKEDWFNVLETLTNYWKNDKTKLVEHALQVKKGMLGSDIVFEKVNDSSIENTLPNDVVSSWKNYFDMDFGGENRAPKFPMPNNYDFLLAHTYYSNDADVQDFVKLTLNRMSEGGIYDHVGGGFARYSVDKFWKVPHFEKMLYDNAQLISIYSKAYKKYKTSNYSNVVKNSVVFINREMTSPEGGFYSSYDADSEGEEGKFYVWSLTELKDILGEKAGVFIDFYSVTPNGNWEEDKNILHITKQAELVARDHDINLDELFETIENANNLLYEERKKRVPPSLDDKILTSWNALMIIGLLDAYEAFSVRDYLSMAKRTATFISTQLMEDDGRLSRNYKTGKKSINAFLDDYSFAASAFIKLFENIGELDWLQKAEKLVNYSLTHFFDNNSGMFYYTSDLDASLVVRKMEISDNVIPSSNSAMAKNLFLLSKLLGNDEYRNIAIQMLTNVKEEVLRYNRYYSNWADLANWLVHPFYEIIVVGENAEKVVQEINSIYLPNCVVAYSLIESDFLLFKDRFKEGKTLIYVCKDNACQMPVETVDEALKLVNQ